MKAKRIKCKDLSKLKELGFAYSPKCHTVRAFYRKEKVTVNMNGWVTIYNASIRNLEVFAELLKNNLIEFVEVDRNHVVKMTEDEYRRYLEEKD